MLDVKRFHILILFSAILFTACERKEAETSTKIKFAFPEMAASSSSAFQSMSNGGTVSSSSFSGPNPSSINDIKCFYVFVSGPEAEMRKNTCDINSAAGTYQDRFGIVVGGVLRGQNIEVSVPSGDDRSVTLVGFNSSESGYCPPVSGVDKTKLSNPFIVGKAGSLKLEPGATQEVAIVMSLDINKYIRECAGPDFGNHMGGSNGDTLAEPDQISLYTGMSTSHISRTLCHPFQIEMRKNGSNVKTATAKQLNINKVSNGPMQVTTTYGVLSMGGSVEGGSGTAKFNNPSNMVYDSSGNAYVADTNNNKIRKVAPDGTVSTFAGTGTAGYADNAVGINATFKTPWGIAIDKVNNILYVSDQSAHTIRKIDITTTSVTTFAGLGNTSGSTDNTGTAARFYSPAGLALDTNGNLFVADSQNHKIRKITPAGVVTTFSGSGSLGANNGTYLTSTFNKPMGIAFDTFDNLYVADRDNHLIRRLDAAGNAITLAGNGSYALVDSTLAASSFNYPTGVAVDSNNKIYVADYANSVIRKIDIGNDVVTTIAGNGFSGSVDGAALSAQLYYPTGIVFNPAGELLIIDNTNHSIRKLASSTTSANMLFYNNYADCYTGVAGTELSNYSFAVGDVRKTGYFRTISPMNTSENFWLSDVAGVMASSSTINYVAKQDPTPPANQIYTVTTTASYNNYSCVEVLVYGYHSSYTSAAKIGSGGVTITPSISGADASRIYLTSDCSSDTAVNSFFIPQYEIATKIGIRTRDYSSQFTATVTLTPSGAVSTPTLSITATNIP